MPGEGGEVVNKLRPMSATTLEKFGYMLETPPYPTLLEDSSDNALGDADNQQGSRSEARSELTPQRLHAELLAATIPVALAYLAGACHDATFSHPHRTVRLDSVMPGGWRVSPFFWRDWAALVAVPRGPYAQPVDSRNVGPMDGPGWLFLTRRKSVSPTRGATLMLRVASQEALARMVSSWHPQKRARLDGWLSARQG